MIKEEDLVETFSRSGGAGGQHVNKVSSRVTLVHRPTGITVTCESSRSQTENRRLAREWLAAKLVAKESAERHRALAAASRERRRRAARSRSTKRKLVESKRRKSEIKRLRKPPTL